jgi:hypothetical protein
MSDKQIALETIRHLPESATLVDIARRLEFVAAARRGLDQVQRGETVPHEQVKRELAVLPPARGLGRHVENPRRALAELDEEDARRQFGGQ